MLYLCYRTFMRNNKEDDLGAFAVSAFWVSLTLILGAFIVISIIQILQHVDYFQFIKREVYYITLISTFFAIYFYFKRRKNFIINRFSKMKKKEEIIYFYILVTVFFFWFTGYYLAKVRFEIFG